MRLDLSRRRLRSLAADSSSSGVVRLAASILGRRRSSTRLLVVGTEQYEPWHLVAHLQGHDALASNVGLVRHVDRPGPGAPHDLGLDQLSEVGRDDVVLLVSPDDPGAQLLERLDQVRRRSGGFVALASDATTAWSELDDTADETAYVARTQLEGAQHVLSELTTRPADWWRRPSAGAA